MDDALLAAIRWFPEVRGILIVATGFLILCGSVYALLATNLGMRQGFLIAAGGLAGWMAIMGAVWWIYGIGLQGRSPEWKPREVVVGDLALSSVDAAAGFPEGWEKLPPGDAEAAEAEAAAGAVLTDEDDPEAPFTAATDFKVLSAYSRGGEDSWLGLRHAPHYALVQVQAVKPQEAEPGQAPPPAEVDPDEPVLSVVMVRDLGSLRLRPAVVTIVSLVLFGIVANVLHRRDKELMAARTGEG
jgi:hypothetical protein